MRKHLTVYLSLFAYIAALSSFGGLAQAQEQTPAARQPIVAVQPRLPIVAKIPRIPIPLTPEQQEWAQITALGMQLQSYPMTILSLPKLHEGKSEEELKQIAAYVTDHFNQAVSKLKQLSEPEQTKSVENRWHAVVTLLSSFSFLNDPSTRDLAEKYFEETLYECKNLDSCFQLNKELAVLIDLMPDMISDPKYQAKIHATIDSLKFPFATDMLHYRFNSLFVRADFLANSQLKAKYNYGKAPRLDPASVTRIEAKLNELTDENSYWKKSSPNEEQIFTCLILKEKLVVEENLDCLNLKPGKKLVFDQTVAKMPKLDIDRLKEHSKEIRQLIERAYHSAVSIKLYMLRVNELTPKTILSVIKSAIDVGIYSDKGKELLEDPLAAYMMLQEFSRIEFTQPLRHEWAEVLKKISTVLNQDLYPWIQIETLTDKQFANLKAADTQVAEFFTRHMLSPWLADTKDFTLLQKELFLAENFPQFHSFAYQRHATDMAFFEIIIRQQMISVAKAPIRKQKMIKELSEIIPEALTRSLTLACYGYWLPESANAEKNDPLTRPEYMQKYVSPFNPAPDLEATNLKELDWNKTKLINIDLRQACGADYRSTEKSVIEWVHADYEDKIYHERNVTVGMKIGEMFLMGFSSKAAGITGGFADFYTKHGLVKAANFVMRKDLAKVANKNLFEKGLYYLANTGTPHLMHAAVGALTFTAVQHSTLATLSMIPGVDKYVNVPWFEYDNELSVGANIWKNYGEELVTGLAIFFFAPMIQTQTFKWGQKWAGLGKLEGYELDLLMKRKALTLGQETRLTTAQIAGDTLVFASIPYIDRTVRSFLFEDHDNIIQPWEETQKEFLDALNISLFFKSFNTTMFPGKMSKVALERIKEKRGDLYGALELTPEASARDIEKAYKKITGKNHPDRIGENPEALRKYKEAVLAYETLGDQAKRTRYDALEKIIAEEGAIAGNNWLTQMQDVFASIWGTRTKEDVNPFEKGEPKRLEYHPDIETKGTIVDPNETRNPEK